MKTPYTKPVLSYPAQLSLLKNRGVIINDDKAAEKILSHINYYRLSGYMFPFLEDKSSHTFKNNTNFDEIIDLYNFDQELRSLIFNAIAPIEISIRTNILYSLAHEYNAFWIADSSLFNDFRLYAKHMEKVEE
jgi:abortive infection bacteriophage resistance protein